VKAIILSGGKGTRGKPFTDFFPKAMIPVNGKPLIDYIVNYISSFDFIDQIIIVSDFTGLGSQIKHYFEGKNDSKKIKFVQDSGNGTGGDLLYVSKFLKNTPEFVLWFVDNLCAIDIKKMSKFFKEKKSLACIATRIYRKEETGFATVKDGIITKFIEKPLVKLKDHECLGVYILKTKILEEIKKKAKSKKQINLSFDILEKLSKKKLVCAYDIGNRPWVDVESPAILERNKKTVNQIIQQMNK
jgi:mannose-1-phosphate guanylyltransferase